MENSDRSKNLLPWFAAFFAMHLAARGIAIYDALETLTFSNMKPWLRGGASDLLMALLLAFFALWLQRKKNWLPQVFFVFWAVALAGNREYVSEWAANISVLDIAGLFDPEFVEGSVLTPRLFITACALGAAGQAAFMLTLMAGESVVFTRRILWILTALPLVAFLFPVIPPQQFWIQENLIEDNLRQIADALTPDRSKPSPSSVLVARRFVAAARKRDLEGELIVTPHPDANILIINVESLSDATLQNGWMPYLKKLSENNLYYPQYILPNLTTIRGLYAQFCGEWTYLGRFGRDNMPRHINKKNVRCLPEILTEQGYYTVYMQGAGLGFQNKGRIIPATGFIEVLGREEMPGKDLYSDWGIDDNTLFNNAMEKIETVETQNQGAPWMISLMTVSTHHPYGVDPSFKPDVPLRERAFLYADEAIRTFIERLQKAGRLDNTLIIISGDESREKRKAQGLGATIIRNQGLLVILSPGREKQVVTAPYMQSDLLVSVLDYAVLEMPPEVGGRSIFREYKNFRQLAFGNYAHQSMFAVWEPGALTQCNTDKWECNVFQIGDKSLFDPELKFEPKRTVSGPTRALFLENENYWRR